ncbi:MAG: hypothetical protein NVSMB55_20890 [Mycobacteriales bacterium]
MSSDPLDRSASWCRHRDDTARTDPSIRCATVHSPARATLPAGTDDFGIDALISDSYRTSGRSAIGQAESVDVEQVAAELYGLPPEKFIAARTAAARADKAKAKQISALRKPSVGAWLVNTLARNDPELLEQLLALGPALADAQRSGQGVALRELGNQRRQLVGAVTATAFRVAGRAPTAAARAEVESTLDAALADPATADAVRSGRLVRPLSYAGFGEVDLDGAVAATPTVTSAPRARPPSAPDRSSVIAAAESRAQDAAGALDDAVRACQHARSEQDAAESAAHDAARQVTTAEEALRNARQASTVAEAQTRRARHRSEAAAKAVAAAQQRAETARAVLDKLRRG